jgi:hypothetical protein
LLKKATAALAGRPASRSKNKHQRSVDSEAQSPSKERNANFSPAAELRPAPDDRGESDFDYFASRPHVDARVRLPFENEFPPGVLEPGRGEPGRGVFVHVFLVSRDPVTNAPGTRARAIVYTDDGGRA